MYTEYKGKLIRISSAVIIKDVDILEEFTDLGLSAGLIASFFCGECGQYLYINEPKTCCDKPTNQGYNYPKSCKRHFEVTKDIILLIKETAKAVLQERLHEQASA